MTVRKRYHRLGKYAVTPLLATVARSHFGTFCPEVGRACQRRDTPQEWGRNGFRVKRQTMKKRRNA